MGLVDFVLILQIFALLNPLSSFPFLMAAYKKKMNVKSVALKSLLVAFLVALTIVFIGPYLFNIFGININSFRIAGGIILLILGINMVNPKEGENKKTGKVNSVIAIIATPMLTGPATISFITIKVFELGTMYLLTNLLLSFLLVGIVFFLFSIAIKKINITVVDIMSRILGLFITAVSIEMIASGFEGIIQLIK
jgi:multiple antibiotic resistance protein